MGKGTKAEKKLTEEKAKKEKKEKKVKEPRIKEKREKKTKEPRTKEEQEKKPKVHIQLFSIRNKIFVCFLVPIVFIVIVGTVAYQRAAAGLSEEFQESTIQTINMATEYIDMSNSFIETEAMKYAFGDLNKYYLDTISDKFVKADLVKSTKSAMNSAQGANALISNIHLVTQSKVAMLSTVANDVATLDRMGILEDYTEQMPKDGKRIKAWVDKHTLLDEYLSLREDDYILSYHMMSENKKACVVIDVKKSAIYDFLSGLDLGTGSIIGFVTESGREIICENLPEGAKSTLQEGEQVFFGQEFFTPINEEDNVSGAQEVSFNGKDYLFIYSRSVNNHATITALVPLEVIVGKAESIKNLTVTLVILAILIACVVGFVITAGIQKNMKRISKVLGEVAKGNLTVQVKTKSKDEFKALAESTADMIQKNKNLLSKVGDATKQLEDSAREVQAASEVINNYSSDISQAVGGINTGMARQSDYAQECVERTGSLSDEIQEVSKTVVRVEDLVGETEQMIGRGMSMVQALGERARETTDITVKVGRSIELLREESEIINKFVGTITEISEQTNLLSLNASIEAARAGEAGRGFGVVAEEIRKLADDSARAAGEIKSNVVNISKQTQNSVESAKAAEEMVALQGQVVQEVVDVFKEMSHHMTQLVDGLKEIITSTERADAERGQTLQSVENISVIIDDTAKSATTVNEVISKLMESVENLNCISAALDENMVGLKTEISAFKTE